MIVPDTSKDLADWDGDGLLNGEEIYVTTVNGITHVVMKSDPLLPDTDGDGYSDYEEVKGTAYTTTSAFSSSVFTLSGVNGVKTSPVKITLPVQGKNPSTTLRDVMNNSIFPEEYVKLSTERDFWSDVV